MNQEIRKLFPALERTAYLNSAAVSPLPVTSVEAVVSQLKDVSLNGSENYPEWVATKDRARALIAEMLGVRSDEIAFMRNTSDSIASIAAGIDWAEGDNIVSFANEFPANYYPWRRVRDRYGVELRLCPERNGRIDQDEFISLIDANTKVIAISSVQFSSGFKADLERIGEAAHAANALFVVDIIQGFGATGYDLPSLNVDIAAGASHKWLCAPEGCGILYVSQKVRDLIDPVTVGWISVETPWDFDDREQEFRHSALAWESGTGPSALFYGLEESLKLPKQVGLTAIERHLDELTEYLCEKLAEKNYDIVSSRLPEERSAIVSMTHRGGIPALDIYHHLRDRNVIVSARGDRVRISPHFYNTAEDIDRLIASLPD
jgi:cysteine desulfurase / selenocysteine lyase